MECVVRSVVQESGLQESGLRTELNSSHCTVKFKILYFFPTCQIEMYRTALYCKSFTVFNYTVNFTIKFNFKSLNILYCTDLLGGSQGAYFSGMSRNRRTLK